MYTWNLSKFVFGKRVHAIIVCKNLESQYVHCMCLETKNMEQTTMRFNLNLIDSNFQYTASTVYTIHIYERSDYSSIGRVIASNGLHRAIISVYATQSSSACLLACVRSLHCHNLFSFRFSLFFVPPSEIYLRSHIRCQSNMCMRVCVCFIIYSVSLCLGSMKGAIKFLFIDSSSCFFPTQKIVPLGDWHSLIGHVIMKISQLGALCVVTLGHRPVNRSHTVCVNIKGLAERNSTCSVFIHPKMPTNFCMQSLWMGERGFKYTQIEFNVIRSIIWVVALFFPSPALYFLSLVTIIPICIQNT